MHTCQAEGAGLRPVEGLIAKEFNYAGDKVNAVA
jgi:hypothetical protein